MDQQVVNEHDTTSQWYWQSLASTWSLTRQKHYHCILNLCLCWDLYRAFCAMDLMISGTAYNWHCYLQLHCKDTDTPFSHKDDMSFHERKSILIGCYFEYQKTPPAKSHTQKHVLPSSWKSLTMLITQILRIGRNGEWYSKICWCNMKEATCQAVLPAVFEAVKHFYGYVFTVSRW